jgi:hypothetical protein
LGIEDVKTRHEAALLRVPNVIGVGIGRRAGVATIEVMVSALIEHAAIPESIEGYPVQVVVTGRMTADADRRDDDGT